MQQSYIAALIHTSMTAAIILCSSLALLQLFAKLFDHCSWNYKHIHIHHLLCVLILRIAFVVGVVPLYNKAPKDQFHHAAVGFHLTGT